MLAETPDPYLLVRPRHQPINRRPGEAQFGLGPDAAIITGLTDIEIALVRRLDGTRGRFASCRDAQLAGVTPTRWRELLDLLTDLGVVVTAGGPITTSSPGGPVGGGNPSVLVEGSGALAEHITALLGQSLRVSHRVCLRPGGPRPRTDAVAEPPALVVLIGAPALDPRAGDPWLDNGTAHLPITVSGPRATVGPLVVGPRGPCLWCLDLHRADRDDAWPMVMTQLCSPGPLPACIDGDPLAVVAAHLTAGTATALALGVLTGHRPPIGVSLDLWVPWPRIDYRRWEVHPRCTRHPDLPGGELRRRHEHGGLAGTGGREVVTAVSSPPPAPRQPDRRQRVTRREPVGTSRVEREGDPSMTTGQGCGA